MFQRQSCAIFSPAKSPAADTGTALRAISCWCKTGRGVPTINLHVDYHAPAMPGDLTIRGRIVRMGSQFSTSEAHVFDADGKLVASGRGTYLTAPPKP